MARLRPLFARIVLAAMAGIVLLPAVAFAAGRLVPDGPLRQGVSSVTITNADAGKTINVSFRHLDIGP